MTIPRLTIPKRYKDGRPYLESYVDDIKNSVEQWALAIERDMNQIAKDTHGTNYPYNNNGVAVRAVPLVDYLAALSENETVIGAWTFSAAPTFSGGFKIAEGQKLSLELGETSYFICSDAVDGVVSLYAAGVNAWTVDGDNTWFGLKNSFDLRLYSDAGTTLKASIAGATGDLVTVGNLQINSGADLKLYSDVGTTLKASIDGATGNASLSGTLGVTGTITAGVANFSGLTTHSLGLTVPVTKPLNMNVGGTTYWTEASAGLANLYVSGTKALNVTPTLFEVYTALDFAIPLGKHAYLDAGAGQASIYAAATNDVRIAASGTDIFRVTSGSASMMNSKPFFPYAGTVSDPGISNDPDTNTGIYWPSADNLGIAAGGVLSCNFKTEGILLPDTDPPTANYMNRNSGVKAWLNYTDGSGTVSNSYNIESVTSDDGDGLYVVNFDTDFASTEYVVCGSAESADQFLAFTHATTLVNVRIWDVGSAGATDANFSIIAIGDQ